MNFEHVLRVSSGPHELCRRATTIHRSIALPPHSRRRRRNTKTGVAPLLFSPTRFLARFSGSVLPRAEEEEEGTHRRSRLSQCIARLFSHAKEGSGCFVSPPFRAKRAQVPREGRRAERGMQRSDDRETDKQQWGREGMRRKLPVPPPPPPPIMASGGLAIVSGGRGGCRCAYTV